MEDLSFASWLTLFSSFGGGIGGQKEDQEVNKRWTARKRIIRRTAQETKGKIETRQAPHE